jgi:hypothetical protein
MNVTDTLLAVSGLLGGGGGGGGGEAVLINKTISANGTYNASDDNADGYSSVTVNVADSFLDNITTSVGFSLSGAVLTGDIDIDLGTRKWVSNDNWLGCHASTATNVTIHANGCSTTLGKLGNGSSSNIHAVTLDVGDTPYAVPVQFAWNTGIHKLLGTPVLYENINTATNRRFNAPNLDEIYFVPNKIAVGGVFSSGTLVNASLVSLANALKSGTATLTLSSANKGNCSAITGTVSQVTDGGNTYDFFTADPNGTVTLTEFITTTKGWTLA